ncbi:MAG: acyltransferase [Sphingomonadales bacterium]|nr:acyltransferase [Sphingomonadales bacterium]
MGDGPARLYGLDALRGIAAICVLGLHVHAIYGGFPDLFGKAYLAVDFFFMLSGYLMARTYGERLASGMSGLQFFRIRYRRLWPVMAVGGLVGAYYLWTATQNPWLFGVLFAANIMLVPVGFQQELFPLNVPAWSVFLELFVNAIHGFILARLRTGALVVIALCALAATVRFARDSGALDLGARPSSLVPGLFRAILSYSIGMMLFQRWRDGGAPHVSPLLAAVGFPALLVLPWALGIAHWAYDLAFVLFACPLLLAGGLALRHPSTLALALGSASFPLYAVHFAVLRQAQLMGIGAVGAVGLAIAVTALVTIWTQRKPRRSATANHSASLAFAKVAPEGHR